jgi:hypothetical protein
VEYFQQQQADELIDLSVMDLAAFSQDQITIHVPGRIRQHGRVLKKIEHVYIQ